MDRTLCTSVSDEIGIEKLIGELKKNNFIRVEFLICNGSAVTGAIEYDGGSHCILCKLN